MPHPDEGLIHAWLDGELDAVEAARVETLVTNDPVWAAAAAEARGLIAAGSRIAGALDYVPANVVPRRGTTPRRVQWWMARAAAVLLVVVGTVAVWQHQREGSALNATAAAPPVAAAPADLPVPQAPAATARAAEADRRALEPGPSVLGQLGAGASAASGAGAARDAVSSAAPAAAQALTPASPSVPAPAAEPAPPLTRTEVATGTRLAAPAAKTAAEVRDEVANAIASGAAVAQRADRNAALAGGAPAPIASLTDAAKAASPLCFAPRPPGDSILRLSPSALADSIRRGVLARHGDTLVAVPARVIGIAAPCPAP